MRRNILVSSASTIRRNMGLLEIETAERCARIPFREVGSLVIESAASTMTSTALSSLMESRSSVTVCGPNHMPIGTMLPVEGHCRQAEVIEYQLAVREPVRKRLRKRIVEAKIVNKRASWTSCKSIQSPYGSTHVPFDPTMPTTERAQRRRPTSVFSHPTAAAVTATAQVP